MANQKDREFIRQQEQEAQQSAERSGKSEPSASTQKALEALRQVLGDK